MRSFHKDKLHIQPTIFWRYMFLIFCNGNTAIFKRQKHTKQTDCTLQHGTPNVNNRSWRFSRCRAWTWLWSASARCKASGNGRLNLAWGGVGGIFAAAGAVGCTSAALASVLLPLWAPWHCIWRTTANNATSWRLDHHFITIKKTVVIIIKTIKVTRMSSLRLARINHFTIPLKQILYKQAP